MSEPAVGVIGGSGIYHLPGLSAVEEVAVDTPFGPPSDALVSGRLAKRVRQRGLSSYAEYLNVMRRERGELQQAVDLLTTNETYFFREPRHFDFLRENVLPELRGRSPVRVWSGACSSGEEPYSIAMVLAACLGSRPWEVVASDISTRMLEKAAAGQYGIGAAGDIPRPLLASYCLKGVGPQGGTFLVEPSLRSRVRFLQVNLNQPLPDLGVFDLIFLRNVMIYFDLETKREVMKRMLPLLRAGGYFFVSHSESLNGITDELQSIRPSIYRKRDA